MHLVFLGSGGSWPSTKRNVPAVALRMNSEIILFDCGEGTQRQFMFSSLSFMQVSKILLTHLHADHFLGIPGLIQTMAFNGRGKELEIFGPEGTERTVTSIVQAGYFQLDFELIIREIKSGETINSDSYDIRTASGEHCVPSIAYCIEERMRWGKFDIEKAKELNIPPGPLYRKLQEGKSVKVEGRTIRPEEVLGPQRKGRKVVYSGDTRPCRRIVELADGCDVLIHDGTLETSLKKKAKEFGHSTVREAALIARRAGAKVLFLVHVSPRYEETELLEKEARSVFKESYVASDFMEFEVRFSE